MNEFYVDELDGNGSVKWTYVQRLYRTTTVYDE